jgi:hypothetical protein
MRGPFHYYRGSPPSLSFLFLFFPFSWYPTCITSDLVAEAIATIAKNSINCLAQKEKKEDRKKNVNVFVERPITRATVVATTTRRAWVGGGLDNAPTSPSSSWRWSFFLSLAKREAKGEEQEQWGKELPAFVILVGSTCKRGKARKGGRRRGIEKEEEEKKNKVKGRGKKREKKQARWVVVERAKL